METDHEIFLHLRRHCNKLAKSKKSHSFKSHFVKYNNSQKSLYQFVDLFLAQSPSLTLPPADSLQTITDQFNTFFTEKIINIRKNFPGCDNVIDNAIEYKHQHFSHGKLTDFEPVTLEEIELILNETGIKTSSIDPLPSSLIKENSNFWLPYIYVILSIFLCHLVVLMEPNWHI